MIGGSLFLLLLAFGSLILTVPVAEHGFRRQGPLITSLAVAVLACGHLTIVFHVLLAFGRFDRATATIVLVAGAIAALVFGPGPRALDTALRRLLDSLLRVAATGRWPASRFVYALAGVFGVVTLARALVLPTVGWDSLTYHFVKAGMWVQSGGPITLQAPGGWGMYASRFGGGEVFTAWAMLPFHNDLLACAVDVGWWVLLALALFALAGEFGLRARHRTVIVLYVSFLPAVWNAVGWGYVDLATHAFATTGLVFAMRSLRTGHAPSSALALLALGLACGVKLTSVPLLMLTGLALGVAPLFETRGRRERLALWSVGCVGALLVLCPWPITNLIATGFPLEMPIVVAGFQLGPDDPAFAWYQARDIAPYTLQAEANALLGVFRLPNIDESHLSVFSLLPLLLAPVGAVRVFRRSRTLRPGLLLAASFGIATLCFYYSRSFAVVRLDFAWVNGRFLVPVVMIGLILAFLALPLQGRWRDGLAGYLTLSTLVHMGFALPARLTTPSATGVLIGTLATAIALGGGVLLMRGVPRVRGRRVWAPVALLALVIAGVAALAPLHAPERRYALLANRVVDADWFRYWWVAARMLDEEPGGRRIALTGGDWQDADLWQSYYFMGSDLQNTLHYVPISVDGRFIPFGPDQRREREGDFEAWVSRVRETEITHVMSFIPSSLELRWMEGHPAEFQRLAGHEDRWALFRVIAAR